MEAPPTPSDASAAPGAAAATLVLLAAMGTYFLALGHPPLWDANEPFYAEPPKEVLEWAEGDFWAPTFNGRTYFGHAPLSTWIAVPFYAVFGATEAAGRLPMAIAACLTILATFSLGRSLGGRRTGLLAALVLAATPKHWLYSRQFAGDVYLTTMLAWAFALLLQGLERPSRGRVLAAHALAGAAVLAKGPLALALYVPALVLLSAWARPRPPLRALRPWAALGAFVALGAPWFVAMTVRFWPKYHQEFFGWHHFQRFLGETTGERSPFFYVQALLGDAEPWILVLPLAAWLAWRRGDRRPAAVLPWVAGAATLVFFSLSGGKRSVYLLPLYPMLAVVVAPVLAAAWDGAHRLLARSAGLLLAAAAFGAAACLWMLQTHEPRVRPEVYVPFGVLVLAGLLLGWGGARGRGRLVVVSVLACTLATQAAAAAALPALGRLRPVPALAARIRAEQDPAAPEPAVVYRARIQSLCFYLGRRTETASDPGGLRRAMGSSRRAFVLCPRDHLDDLVARDPGLRVREVASAPNLDFHFARSVLGEGPTTSEVLLLVVELP